MLVIFNLRVWRVFFWVVAVTAFGLLLVTTAPAFAQGDVHETPTRLDLRTWAIIAGGLSPAAAYLLNRFWPNVAETVKVLVLLVVAAVAGGIAQALDAGAVGLNGQTLDFVVDAIIAAVGAHFGIFKNAGLNVKLGSSVTAARSGYPPS